MIKLLKPLMELIKKYWIGILLALASIAALDLLYGTVCLSKVFVGLPCPACGMTRATKLLLTGHFKESFHMHPLLPLVALGVIGYPIIKKTLKNYVVIIKFYVIICLVIFFGVYIYRMRMYYPNIEPMVYYKDNYLYKIMALLHSEGRIK